MSKPAFVPSHAYVPYRQDWLDRHREEAIDPALPIVDPHHHFYDRPRPRFMFDDLLADTRQGHNIVATVYVESASMYRADGPEHLRCVGEVEFVNGYAAMSASGNYGDSRFCAGIVGGGKLNIGADKVRETLEALIRAGNGRLRGIRNSSTWDADPEVQPPTPDRPPGLLLDPRFREGFALLAPLGLSFDAYLYHPQIGDLADLARAFPGTGIVLNHIGAPLGLGVYASRREEVFKQWGASIRELAHCPNVTVKLGGLGMRMMGFDFHARENPPTSEQLAGAWKPYIETVIQAFGPERCMFESNFPPDRGSCSYGVMWNAFKRIAAGYADPERRHLFAGTAARIYRLDLPALAK